MICTHKFVTESWRSFSDVPVCVRDSDTDRSGISDVIFNRHDSPNFHVPGRHDPVWKFVFRLSFRPLPPRVAHWVDEFDGCKHNAGFGIRQVDFGGLAVGSIQ